MSEQLANMIIGAIAGAVAAGLVGLGIYYYRSRQGNRLVVKRASETPPIEGGRTFEDAPTIKRKSFWLLIAGVFAVGSLAGLLLGNLTAILQNILNIDAGQTELGFFIFAVTIAFLAVIYLLIRNVSSRS